MPCILTDKDCQGFAEKYISERHIHDESGFAHQYIQYVTKLMLCLAQDKPLPDEFINNFRSFIIKIGTLQIPYDYMAHFIYKHSYEIDFYKMTISFDEIVNSYEIYQDESSENNLSPDNFEKIIKKIQRSIHLAIYQKEFIQERVEKANRKVKKIEGKANTVEKQVKTLVQDVYSSFITILGIFSAIIIAVFGGITFVGTSLSKVEDISSFSLFLSTGILSLLLIIYFLFTWVDKLRSPVNTKNCWARLFFTAVCILLAVTAYLSFNYKMNEVGKMNKNIKVAIPVKKN